MKRIRKVVFGLSAFVALSAEAPEAKYFTSVPHRTPDGEVAVDADYELSSGDTKTDIGNAMARGYELIGYSNFNGAERSKAAALKQGRKVGAELVIAGSKYVETQNTGAIGSSSFSRFGATSFFIPMSVRRYDQVTMYFRKTPHVGIGVGAQALSPDDHARLGTNKGVRITAVVNGSPAFLADVLPGDIILSVNDSPVYDGESLRSAITASFGKDAHIAINRNGVDVQKTIAIPADGHW